MKPLCSLAVLTALLLFSCKKQPKENGYAVHAEFYDEKGGELKEVFTNQVLVIRSQKLDEFLFKNPQANNNLPPQPTPNNTQVMFDNIPTKIISIEPGKLAISIPTMNLMDYKLLTITIRFNNLFLRIIERLWYRPTVTATILAGTPSSGAFNLPAEMTLDASGNLYVIDQRTDAHDRIIRVTPTGETSVFADGGGSFGRLVGLGFSSPDTALYVADATAQQVKAINKTTPTSVRVVAGSGATGNTDGSGTGASFWFGTERVDDFGTNEKGQGLTVDLSGNIYVGNKTGTGFSGFLSSIRRITAAGAVTTMPGSFITAPSGELDLISPNGLTLSSVNELVYTTGASGFYQGLVKLSSTPALVRLAGKVSNETLKDGTGSAAEFCYPKALQFRNSFHWVADGSNGALRRVTEDGDVITIAGVGHFATPTWLPCGSCAPAAASYVMPSIFNTDPQRHKTAAGAIVLDQLGGIAVTPSGIIYLSDYGANFRCIWKITIA